MGHIKIDELSNSLKEYINTLGLTEEQVNNLIKQFSGDKSQLQTNAKGSLVDAINELFQSANNGKELIATAIGEPLNSNNTFNAMSTGINGLLSTFKTNMMNNGVVVESSDKFKQLIDKIATLADSEGKGIKFAEGTYRDFTEYLTTSGTSVPVSCDLNFTPTLIFVMFDSISNTAGTTISNVIISNKAVGQFYMNYTLSTMISNMTSNGFSMVFTYGNNSNITFNGVTWYAIGVGEEDTTLRDSLASILQDEGVSVTSEDKLANLITKTDNEFTNKNTKAEDTRSTLAGLMKDGGYKITGEEDIDRLLEIMRISGVTFDSYKYTCTDEYILDKMYPMPQTHEAIPSGVTDAWKHQSRWENQERPTATAHNCGQSGCPGAVQFQALGAWSNVYRVDGTGFTQNTGIEMKDIKVYGWYNGQWELVQHLPVPNGNFYTESFSGDSNTYFADSVKQTSTSKTIILREANKINGENCMYHPFSEIKNFDLKYEYVYTCIDLRKVKFDENGIDDRDATHYCANCGGDWWLAEGLAFDSSWQHNHGIAQPKIVEITNDWQRFSMTTVPENWENGFPE